MALLRGYAEGLVDARKGLLFHSTPPKIFYLCWLARDEEHYLYLKKIISDDEGTPTYEWTNSKRKALVFEELEKLCEVADLLPKNLKLVVSTVVDEFTGLIRNKEGAYFIQEGYQGLVRENRSRIQDIENSRKK